MALLSDVRDPSGIGRDSMASKARFAALDPGLFARLPARPSTFEALVAATGVAPAREPGA